jgi:hypothetical protein
MVDQEHLLRFGASGVNTTPASQLMAGCFW